MKTATMEELGNVNSEAWAWVKAGEEVTVSEQGKVIARLIPEKDTMTKEPEEAERIVDWTTSAAFTMDRSKMRMITAEESAALWEEIRGPRF